MQVISYPEDTVSDLMSRIEIEPNLIQEESNNLDISPINHDAVLRFFRKHDLPVDVTPETFPTPFFSQNQVEEIWQDKSPSILEFESRHNLAPGTVNDYDAFVSRASKCGGIDVVKEILKQRRK